MKIVSAPCALSIDCLPVLVQTRSITACKCIAKLVRLRRPSASPNTLDQGLQVRLQTRSMRASKCISKYARLRLPNSHVHCIQVHISKHTRSWPPSVSPNSLDRGQHVHLRTPAITAFKCISTLARLWRPSSHDPGSQVHRTTRSFTASEGISEFTQSSFSGAPRIALKHRLQPVQIYSV